MRNLYTLYGIAIKSCKNLGGGVGICTLISQLYFSGLISGEEKKKLSSHFLSNKPTIRNKHKTFAINESFYGGLWWWQNSPEGNEQRTLFLKALRESTKPWYQKMLDKIWWI